MTKDSNCLSIEQQENLLSTLQTRFEENRHRHINIKWNDVQDKLLANMQKLWSLNEMENTGGEPDVVEFDTESEEYFFVDCSIETPIGRRSLCYDREAWDSRKKNKPENTALDLAATIGIELLTEDQYRTIQQVEEFDKKTSSWVQTPENIRRLGGALFCDRRYDTVFVYHNGAESYYAARGFRGMLKV